MKLTKQYSVDEIAEIYSNENLKYFADLDARRAKFLGKVSIATLVCCTAVCAIDTALFPKFTFCFGLGCLGASVFYNITSIANRELLLYKLSLPPKLEK